MRLSEEILGLLEAEGKKKFRVVAPAKPARTVRASSDGPPKPKKLTRKALEKFLGRKVEFATGKGIDYYSGETEGRGRRGRQGVESSARARHARAHGWRVRLLEVMDNLGIDSVEERKARYTSAHGDIVWEMGFPPPANVPFNLTKEGALFFSRGRVVAFRDKVGELYQVKWDAKSHSGMIGKRI